MNRYTRNIERIEFVVTMACTGKCRHCSEGDHSHCTGHIDADAAVRAVRDICSAYRIRSLMTFGGEPLLFPDVVCAIHRAGAELGIETRQLITNGYFSKDPRRIGEVARRLAESGVNQLLLSVDAFHQETIPLEPVLHFAKCIAETDIAVKLAPAWLVSREDGNPYNIRIAADARAYNSWNQLADGYYYRYISPQKENGIDTEKLRRFSETDIDEIAVGGERIV